MFVRIGKSCFRVHGSGGVSLAKPLDFASPLVDFGAAPPTKRPIQIGDFTGDTTQGAGCNVDELTIVPHCHGTHTETVGHIVDEDAMIASITIPSWMMAALVTVAAIPAGQSNEQYRPPPLPDDGLITAQSLITAWERLSQLVGVEFLKAFASTGERAIIVRVATQATAPRKQQQSKARHASPPYFSTDAIEWCNATGIQHLLIESPSIDRTEDGGLLTNHHLFWNVPAKTHSLTPESWTHKTITESITIDEELADEMYLLNLQVPRLCSDAAPSNPILHRLERLEKLAIGDAV